MADAPRDEPALPAADCDLLRGVDAIARWLGWTRGAARVAIENGDFPSFRQGNGRYAFKSDIIAAFRDIQRGQKTAA